MGRGLLRLNKRFKAILENEIILHPQICSVSNKTFAVFCFHAIPLNNRRRLATPHPFINATDAVVISGRPSRLVYYFSPL
jgi:hypothetical protein